MTAQRFSEMTQYLDSPVWGVMRQQNFAVSSRGQKYLSEHHTIYDAIKAGQAEAAESAMRFHILSIMADLEDGAAATDATPQ